jgi:hypothetical protein
MSTKPRKAKRINRILWNRRPSGDRGVAGCGDIDEIVLHDVTVHVEQMDSGCWWIGIYREDGGYWMGNFTSDRDGLMSFWQQENNGIEWDRDDTHEVTP